MQLAAVGMQVAGTAMQARAQAQQLQYQQAALDHQQAADRAQAAAAQRDRHRELAHVLSANRAAFGAAGIDPDTGSAAAAQLALIERTREVDETQRDLSARSEAYAGLQSGLVAYQRSALPYAAAVSSASYAADTLLRWRRIGEA